jgi:hypothetical protein
MLCYLVVGYDTDQQQAHHDHIFANSEEDALQKILKYRPDDYQPVSAFSIFDLRDIMERLRGANPEGVAEELQSVLRSYRPDGPEPDDAEA